MILLRTKTSSNDLLLKRIKMGGEPPSSSKGSHVETLSAARVVLQSWQRRLTQPCPAADQPARSPGNSFFDTQVSGVGPGWKAQDWGEGLPGDVTSTQDLCRETEWTGKILPARIKWELGEVLIKEVSGGGCWRGVCALRQLAGSTAAPSPREALEEGSADPPLNVPHLHTQVEKGADRKWSGQTHVIQK